MLNEKFEFNFSDDELIIKLIKMYNSCNSKDEIFNVKLTGQELQAILINLIPGRISYKLCMDYIMPEMANKQFNREEKEELLW